MPSGSRPSIVRSKRFEANRQAIRLNDNRAVYRSSFLLDEDLAARQAGWAACTSIVGFEELALLEGWKSVEADPTDHSGHRFLSDAYLGAAAT